MPKENIIITVLEGQCKIKISVVGKKLSFQGKPKSTKSQNLEIQKNELINIEVAI